jgi:hypothetical protein
VTLIDVTPKGTVHVELEVYVFETVLANAESLAPETNNETNAKTGPQMSTRETNRTERERTDARRRTAFNPSTISIASSPGIFVLRL